MPDYTPRAGSTAHKAIEHLKTLPAGTRLACGVLAAAVDAKASALSTHMKKAIAAGMVEGERMGRFMHYWLPGAPPQTDGKLEIGAYADGDLLFSGAEYRPATNEVVLKRHQLEQLVKFATQPLVRLPGAGE